MINVGGRILERPRDLDRVARVQPLKAGFGTFPVSLPPTPHLGTELSGVSVKQLILRGMFCTRTFNQTGNFEFGLNPPLHAITEWLTKIWHELCATMNPVYANNSCLVSGVTLYTAPVALNTDILGTQSLIQTETKARHVGVLNTISEWAHHRKGCLVSMQRVDSFPWAPPIHILSHYIEV